MRYFTAIHWACDGRDIWLVVRYDPSRASEDGIGHVVAEAVGEQMARSLARSLSKAEMGVALSSNGGVTS